jgi:hypothetical protein
MWLTYDIKMVLCNNMYENRPTIRTEWRLVLKDQPEGAGVANAGWRAGAPARGILIFGAGKQGESHQNKGKQSKTNQNKGARWSSSRGCRWEATGRAGAVRVECPFDGLGHVGAAGKNRTHSIYRRSPWAAWQAFAAQHCWGRRSRSEEGGLGVVGSEKGPEVGCGRTKQNQPGFWGHCVFTPRKGHLWGYPGEYGRKGLTRVRKLSLGKRRIKPGGQKIKPKTPMIKPN